jgi:hypothetical protein
MASGCLAGPSEVPLLFSGADATTHTFWAKLCAGQLNGLKR